MSLCNTCNEADCFKRLHDLWTVINSTLQSRSQKWQCCYCWVDDLSPFHSLWLRKYLQPKRMTQGQVLDPITAPQSIFLSPTPTRSRTVCRMLSPSPPVNARVIPIPTLLPQGCADVQGTWLGCFPHSRWRKQHYYTIQWSRPTKWLSNWSQTDRVTCC